MTRVTERDFTPLRATVRLQLHGGFTFDDARAQVDHHAALGISHLYLSPVATAVAGSTHGYDGTDPTTVNPALGGEPALRALAAAARARGMGLLLDIVPNHVATHASNPWWQDLLRHGRRSAYADWFDVEWDAPGCEGRLWLPVLDRPLDDAVRDGVLTLDMMDGVPLLRHHEHAFALDPESCDAARRCIAALVDTALVDTALVDTGQSDPQAGDADRHADLHAIIDAQAYRLAWWRTGSDQVNYRRFFDISTLAGLRMEYEDAFHAVHALPVRLAREGIIDGLRIDHVDGLAEPTGYLDRLRAALDAAGAARGLPAGTLGLHVEKILAPGEALPAAWACDGTTGYDFMDQCSALLHVASGEAVLQDIWAQYGGTTSVADEEWQARREMLDGPLRTEAGRCLRALLAVVDATPHAGDLSHAMYARALHALLARFPVYRTYAGPDGLDALGAAWLARAEEAASRDLGAGDRPALARLAAWLRGDVEQPDIAPLQALRQRFEQTSAPLNAKAVEDTTFYRHARLLSRNEVGSHPSTLSLSPADFHAACQQRRLHWPRAMLATATHDHKRGEDVRARLALLSAWPTWWRRQVAALERHLAPADIPTLPAADRYMAWQTLVAAWPIGLRSDDTEGLADYAARILAWLHKAMREGKRSSHWIAPHEDNERAAEALVTHALLSAQGMPLRRMLARAACVLGPAGARNGLVQVALRLTCPGVPDLYQGGEGWDLSLVDPDNRRPVDHALRRRWDADTRCWQELLRDWQDGAVKARLLQALLHLRAELPAVFAEGSHDPIAMEAAGTLAFLRAHGRQCVLVIVALPVAGEPGGITSGARLPATGVAGGNTTLAVPPGSWCEVLGGARCEGGLHEVATLLARSPVAVWRRVDEDDDGQH